MRKPWEKPKRQRYDEQFKRDAVALLEAGRGAAQLARELGISIWNLRDWKELYSAGGPVESRGARSVPKANAGASGTVELAVQLADLRRELEAVQRQRDIFKKSGSLAGIVGELSAWRGSADGFAARL